MTKLPPTVLQPQASDGNPSTRQQQVCEPPYRRRCNEPWTSTQTRMPPTGSLSCRLPVPGFLCPKLCSVMPVHAIQLATGPSAITLLLWASFLCGPRPVLCERWLLRDATQRASGFHRQCAAGSLQGIWRLNHLCSRSVESSAADLQMPHSNHALTSVPEDSGVIASAGNFLTSGLHPNAPSAIQVPLVSQYATHECSKRREYEQRVRDVEGASFVPLVFSSTGGMGPAFAATFKRLADLLSEKLDCPYAAMLNWLRYRVSFALLRSAVTSLRGSRRRLHLPSSSTSARID